MDQTLAGCRPGIALGCDVMQPRAQRQHQISLGKGLALRIGVAQPHIANIKRVIIGKQRLPAETDGDRYIPRLGKAA